MSEIHPFITVGLNGKWYNNNNLHLGNNQPKSQWYVSDKSFGYLPTKSVECLFIGTFPTWEVVNQIRVGGNLEFFYGSTDSKFWPIISIICILYPIISG
jgi:hypothetical protein